MNALLNRYQMQCHAEYLRSQVLLDFLQPCRISATFPVSGKTRFACNNARVAGIFNRNRTDGHIGISLALYREVLDFVEEIIEGTKS